MKICKNQSSEKSKSKNCFQFVVPLVNPVKWDHQISGKWAVKWVCLKKYNFFTTFSMNCLWSFRYSKQQFKVSKL